MASYSKCVLLSFSSVAVAAAAILIWRKCRRKEFHCVGHVVGLYIYPVKSCKGIPLESAMCLSQGLQHDRRWVITNEKSRFITQREQPSLALVTPSWKTTDGIVECFYLDAPNMDRLEIPLPLRTTEFKELRVFGTTAEGQSAGEEAAAWLSKYLDKPGCQFYHMTKPRYLATESLWGDVAKPTDKHGFGDFAPLLVVTTEALDALNKELDVAVPMKRFRPNIIVNGTKTFEEDNWKQLKIHDAKLRYLKNCERCIMTTVDPEVGMKTGKEPLETLKRTRKASDKDKRYGDSPVFGIHAAVDQKGMIHVGDIVFAME